MNVLKWIGIALGVLILAAVVLVFTLPTAYSVEESVTIKAPRDLVYNYVANFRNFNNWSPWAPMDTAMEVTYEGTDGSVGSAYIWSGNDQVGSGKMTITSMTSDEITLALHFLTPFESKSDVSYKFSAGAEGETIVSWGMTGEMARPMNLMGLFFSMKDMIGKDFRKGLDSLNLRLNAEVEKRTKNGYYISSVDFGTKHYLTIRKTVKMTDISKFFATAFGTVGKSLQTAGLTLAGAPSGLYYSWDDKKGTTDLAAAMPVDKAMEVKGFNLVTVSGKALKIEYFGKYEDSMNAHLGMDAYMKEMGLEPSKLVIEEYVTDPMTEKDPMKVQTNIYYILN